MAQTKTAFSRFAARIVADDQAQRDAGNRSAQTAEYRRLMALEAIQYAVNSLRVSGEIVRNLHAMPLREIRALVQDFADRGVLLGDAAHELNLRFYGVGSVERRR